MRTSHALVGTQSSEDQDHADRLVDHGLRHDGILQLTDLPLQGADLALESRTAVPPAAGAPGRPLMHVGDFPAFVA
jgi:hypothetical protein